MKRYRSHKVVEAAKIAAISFTKFQPPEFCILIHCDDGDSINVDKAWITRHAPHGQPALLVGHYLVRYEPLPGESEGYLSWSPAEAFEKGYTELPPEIPKDL